MFEPNSATTELSRGVKTCSGLTHTAHEDFWVGAIDIRPCKVPISLAPVLGERIYNVGFRNDA
ncbi:hypothetical protein SAMN04488512_1403 [Sulfitobacter litoralis]|jgi:hypothetical protein|uniref:Uncharacterized protein n=1 Tax=Sulfitobacter litoralis TaxID=335975 RepID=A0ABY0T3U2_9RHOB|nr:hypothetical protein SAMN04488512_1403 [Sulfitobacter litoralis]